MFSYFRIAMCRGGSVAQEGRQIAGVSSVVVDRVAVAGFVAVAGRFIFCGQVGVSGRDSPYMANSVCGRA